MSLNTKNVVDSKAFKVTKTVSASATKVKKVLDFINPVNWFRRIVVDNVIKIIVNRIFLVTLGIVGEQAYKIYSKSALKVDAQIDSGVNDIVDSIETDIKEIVNSTDETKEEDLRFMSKSYNLFKSVDYKSEYDLNFKFMEKVIVVEDQNEKEKEE